MDYRGHCVLITRLGTEGPDRPLVVTDGGIVWAEISDLITLMLNIAFDHVLNSRVTKQHALVPFLCHPKLVLNQLPLLLNIPEKERR